MPADVLGELARQCQTRKVAAGEVLFRDGSENRDLYLVHTGHIALEMNVPGRGLVRILTLGPGEMVGWSALLDEGIMTTRAEAVSDSELIVAPADSLKRLCEESHEFGYHLMKQMSQALSRRLVATRLQLLDLFADSPNGLPGGGVTGAADAPPTDKK